MALHQAIGTAREANEALAGLGREPFLTHFAAAEILVFHPAAGEQLAQGQIPLVVLAVDGEAIGIVAFALCRVGDPQVTADDGLDAVGHRVRVKAQRPKKVHRIGNPKRHAALGDHFLQNWIKTHDAVLNGVFGVKAQMNETGGHRIAEDRDGIGALRGEGVRRVDEVV